MMMEVELIESIPPRKMLSIMDQPIARPVAMLRMNIPAQMVPAAINAALPTLSSFLKLNSRPSEKSRKMIPSSDHWCTDSVENCGNSPRCGPTMIPATM